MTAARAFMLLATTVRAVAGCATLPPCPGHGGPAWMELRSTHIDLLTDLDPEDARAALRDFELLREAVLVAAWRRAPEPPGRIVVFVLRDDSERRVFVSGGYLAAFVWNLPLRQSFVIKSGTEHDGTVAGGVVAALGRSYGLQGKARWFDDGLASYLATLTIDDDGLLTYGQVDHNKFTAATRGGLMPFADLWKPVELETRWRFHATSWLAVHYLFNHEPERFARFQRLLIDTKDARAAWREAFADLPDEELDARMFRYAFRGGTFDAFKTQLPSKQYTVTELPVGDARVHAFRALLYATSGAVPDEQRAGLVRAEVNEALRVDPRDIVAVYVQRLFLHEREDDLTVPQQLSAAFPDNPMAWLLLAHAHQVRHESDLAREAMLPLRANAAPETPVGIDVRIARPD